MNWSIIIHIALALQSLQAGTILQEDRGLSDLKCNRYFLAGFIEVDWEKEFQPFAATRGIKDICKTIKNSCCSLEEMTHFRDVYREKKQIIRNVQTSVRYLYRILEKVPASEIVQRCSSSEKCKATHQIDANFEQKYNNLVGDKEQAIQKVDEFLGFVIKYYSGMVCTACDLQLNQFIYTKQTEQGEELGYVYKVDNCFDIFAKIELLVPAIVDIMFLIKIVQIYKTAGASYLQHLDFYLDDYKNLADVFGHLNECSAITKDEFLKNALCKDLCNGAFTLTKFADPQRVFEILEKVVYAFERILIESITDDPEVMENEIKILQFSDGMELISHDKTDDDFTQNAEIFSWYYVQPDNAPFDFLQSFIRFDVDGIAPHLVALNAGIFSWATLVFLLAVLVK